MWGKESSLAMIIDYLFSDLDFLYQSKIIKYMSISF